MAMKINYCFLRGFALAERAKIPLEVVGDDGVLTLRKGQGFDEWISGPAPLVALNRDKLVEIIDGWLNGVAAE
jgi:hypothetical protein